MIRWAWDGGIFFGVRDAVSCAGESGVALVLWTEVAGYEYARTRAVCRLATKSNEDMAVYERSRSLMTPLTICIDDE
jgi:hypothetical protein